MKKTKVIIPALGLLVLSTAASVSGTVAWFSMNTTVTATGMVVKAKSSSTLLIDTASALASNGRLSSGASEKATTSTAPTNGINPTSTVNGTNWFSAQASASSAAAAIANSYSEVASGNVNDFRLASTFYVQAFDATKPTSAAYAAFTGKKLVVDKISVTFTAADQLNPSFRVLVVTNDGSSDSCVFCAPTTTTAPTNQGVASVTDGAATKQAISYATVSGIASNVATLSANNVMLSSLNYNQVYTVNVYLYFDGEDASCFTDNLPAELGNYTVSTSFSLADA